MTTQTAKHEATSLKDDAAIYNGRCGTPSRVPESTHRERRIALALIAHLASRGFTLEAVNNGEETIKVASPKEALEEMYSVGDSTVYFRSPAGKRHWVLWICGNGQDNPSDNGDFEADGWNAALELSAFDPAEVR